MEHATFAPLVFTTSGGASPLTSTFLKHLASRLAEKRDMAYSIGWLWARLNFSLLHSAVMCIRGSRSLVGRALHDSTPDVPVVESRLQTHGTNKRTDLHTEKQGIFTGSLNNHSILAFKIEDHYLAHCTSIITCTGSAHVCLLYCIISLYCNYDCTYNYIALFQK